jgi:peptidoglycan/xylan/chitin deacetylase (PgdA/CDA1 family)
MTVYHLLAAKGTLAIDEVSLVENAVVEPPAPGKAMVSITFDDAWKTQYTQALPLLTKYNMKGTFYVTTQYFNTTKYTGFMTRANVKDLYAKGHEIGGHTVSHPHLTKVSSTTLTAELKNSKATLDTLIGKPITGIAYPFGEYNQKVIDEAKKLGYTNGRTVEGGLNVATTDKFRLYSISPSVATPLSEIKQNIDAAKREGKWLIIAFHEIDTNGREYSNTPAYFEEVLRYLQSTGVSVVTVEQGLRAL